MARDRGLHSPIRLQPPFTTQALPQPIPPWQVLLRNEGAERHSVYYVHQSLVSTLALDVDPTPLGQIARLQHVQLQKWARKSARRVLLLLTIFLPILLIGARPFPTRPGSPYTQGMAVVGFLAWLSILGFVLSLVTGLWLVAGLCVYWWLGSKVLQSEYQYRGFDV